jgi:hypothetical protein
MYGILRETHILVGKGGFVVAIKKRLTPSASLFFLKNQRY